MLKPKVSTFGDRASDEGSLDHFATFKRMDSADFVPITFNTKPKGKVLVDTFQMSSSNG